ncbi:MAG: RNB domain-containing ribonuclease [Solirubrobacterales bacterium]
MIEAVPERQVGVLERRGRFRVVEPLFERGRRLTVDARAAARADIGDIVLVEPGKRGHLQVTRALGRPEVARDVVEALLVDRGFERLFDEAVEAQASSAAAADPGTEARRDLTALATFTIDPASARDFDDAISIERDGDGLRLWVHIADVAAHVAPGTALDAEAQRRGNSVYVPGAVEPMLPTALSSDACSLVPGLPRATVTVETVLGADVQPRATSFYRSLIISDVRLTYEQVDGVLAGRNEPPGAVAQQLALARDLAAALRKRRFERGALALETGEPEFEFDEHGHVRSCRDVVQTESHGLVEEFMILANELVASQLERRKDPTIYRVHERPDPVAIELLVKRLASLDVPTPPIPEHITPGQATELAAQISSMVADYLAGGGRGSATITSLVLRSLKRAVYSTANVGHSGLASPCYCHFTSPIRRYPDLVVHRSLLAAFEGAPRQAPVAELERIALHCSRTEREASDVEYKADDICQAFLLERALYDGGWEQEFEGEVSGVTNGAAFVRFGGLPGSGVCEGFLPARLLRGDWFDLNEEQTALIGVESGKRLRIGDPVAVRVRSVDPPRGRVDLEPAGEIWS